jgi:hypothetical protein
MAVSPQEISIMQKIAVKPSAWKVTQEMDGIFQLAFTYAAPARAEWADVLTKRGEKKTYKTADACFRDIARVTHESVVFVSLRGLE